jgi:hypothetical protein
MYILKHTHAPTFHHALHITHSPGYSEHKNEGMLLGELQFAFVGFYIGQSFTGFAHWKALVVMLCGCDRAAEERRGLFKTFVLMLIAQLKEVQCP